ncbi:MAG: vWA domain-containing protein [Verrucomicrobiota bacterium]
MNALADITLNPTASTPHLVLLALVIAAAVVWLSWRGTITLPIAKRVLVAACRALIVACLLLLALNPGRWVEEREETSHFWTVLVDRSLSMKTEDPLADSGEQGPSRWERAISHAGTIAELAEAGPVEIYPFSDDLGRADRDLEAVGPDGLSTDLASAADSLLTLARNRPDRFHGTIVLTDGRQTDPAREIERVALRSRAMEAPFLILPIGGEIEPVDLALEPAQRQFVAFENQEAQVSARVVAEGLGPIRPEIALLAPDGTEIAREQVELAPGVDEEITFTFPAPEPGVHLYSFKTRQWEGERIIANNEAAFTVTVLDGITEVFMAEGAPYWDSKFLAQMIRQQENLEVTSVYRLADDRFFRVETGDDRPTEQAGNIFPDTAEALGRYDLIVFGKGVEYFLDETRLALLSEFVRDRGGAILFTRGKPYRGQFEGIEFLEPVKWGERVGEPLQLSPTEAGEAAGLFGGLLPGVGDPVWSQLPEIRDSHQCLETKAFTEILLEGKWSLDGRERSLPILMSRRFGRGMIVTLNADGLWQWDFFPSDQGVEGQYERFWGQLMQWAITFSEFLPGQDLSLHLDESIVRPGDPIRARIGHRGGNGESEPQPQLRLYSGDSLVREIPASRPSAASARWEAALTLTEPGPYRVEAIDLNAQSEDTDPASQSRAGPSLPITVLPRPGETEQLSADIEFLERFAELSGGRIISEDDLAEVVSELNSPQETVDREKAVWKPLWDRWELCAMVLFIAGLEWFTRRRSGLL